MAVLTTPGDADAQARPGRWRPMPALEGYGFLLPALAVLLGLVAFPFADGVLTSFTDRAVARPGTFNGLSNYRQLFADPIFRLAVVNSVLLTVAAVAAKLVLGLAGAVLLAERFPLRGLARTLIFLPWAIPALIAGLSWRWMFDETNGVFNAVLLGVGLVSEQIYWLSEPSLGRLSIAVAMVWHGLPFFIMMFLAGLAAIPNDLYEAAAIDGAGAWRRFRSVTLPSLRDVIATTSMLSLIWTFNSFHMVFILTGGGPANRTHILPTLAYEVGMRRSQLGLGAAVMVSFVPVLVVMIVLLTRRMLREER